jgi:RNA polymerase sigma-70 factor (ECF subfamily)
MAAAEHITTPRIADEALIERVHEGDHAAFDVLYERYFPRVAGFVRRRVSNRADAEEIIQEAFINVFTSLDSFRGEAPFAAWVLGVSRRTIAGRFKKKQHPMVPLDGGNGEEDSELALADGQREPTPLEHYECRERVTQLEATARARLTFDQWQLIERHHLKNHSVRRMALDLDRSEDSIKSNLYRARKLLLAR